MKTLSEITKAYLELSEILAEEEFTQEMEELVDLNEREFQIKAVGYGYRLENLSLDANAIDEKIKRLQALKKSNDNVIDKMKGYLLYCMDIRGIEKVISPTLTISTRRSESVEVPDINLLNEDWITEKVVRSPDKIAIKKAIGNGVTVDGAYIKENYSLQIK